ncbi:MAG: ATP-binding protein [Chloroflexota bacterium]
MSNHSNSSLDNLLLQLNLQREEPPSIDAWEAFLNKVEDIGLNGHQGGSKGKFQSVDSILNSKLGKKRVDKLVKEKTAFLTERADQAEHYIQALPDMILQADDSGTILGFKGFSESSIYKHPPIEEINMLGQDLRDIWPDHADKLQKAIEQAIKSQGLQSVYLDIDFPSEELPIGYEIRITPFDEESCLLIFRPTNDRVTPPLSVQTQEEGEDPAASSAEPIEIIEQSHLLSQRDWIRLGGSVLSLPETINRIDDFYQQAVDLLQETCGFYHTQILQINEVRNTIVPAVSYGEMGRMLIDSGITYAIEDHMFQDIIESRRFKFWPDVYQEQRWIPNNYLINVRSEAGFPLIVRDQMVGILDIQMDKINGINRLDLVSLYGLSILMSSAIETIRLREELAELNDEHERLLDFFSREGWSAMRSGDVSNPRGYIFDQTTTKPIEDNLTQPENGETPQIHLTSTAGRLIVRPIDVRGELVGTLGIQDSAENPISAEDHAFIEELSLQISGALENARLLTQTQKKALELQTVAELSSNTATILRKDTLLKNVANLTSSRFGLYHTNIYLLDEDRRTLRLQAASGEVGSQLVETGWTIDAYSQESLAGRVVRSRKSIIVDNVRQEPAYLQNPLLPETRSELSVPLIAGDEILGVVSLQSSYFHAFSREDAQVHQTLANQIAIALQNAKLFEEQIETAERLRELDSLKTEFLANMSHELRTPLNSIIGFADVLLEGIDGELNDRMREDITMIRDGGRHLRNLIGDILDMAKVEAGKMELSYSTIDIKRIAEEVMGQISSLTKGKEVDVVLEIANDLDQMEADRTRVTQILFNLLSNAAKFTEKGSIIITMSRSANDHLRCAVSDSGIGIKEEDLSLVFEQFRQVGGMTHRTAGGTGLGLPITKNLVELHGGKIWVESTYGVGTTFTFTLPLKKIEKLQETE